MLVSWCRFVLMLELELVSDGVSRRLKKRRPSKVVGEG